MRFAATLEFLRAIDYEFPAWAEEYMSRMEETLGDAYSEPVADVRGYIDYVGRRPRAVASVGRMRHAILGAGGVGGLVGGALARAGDDVVLLLRPETLERHPGRLRVESVVLGDFEVDVATARRSTARSTSAG